MDSLDSEASPFYPSNPTSSTASVPSVTGPSPSSTTTPKTAPSSTSYKNIKLNPNASSFYPTSSEALGPPLKYNRLTGAMGAPRKNSPTRPIRLTEAMESSLKTLSIRPMEALGASKKTSPVRIKDTTTSHKSAPIRQTVPIRPINTMLSSSTSSISHRRCKHRSLVCHLTSLSASTINLGLALEPSPYGAY